MLQKHGLTDAHLREIGAIVALSAICDSVLDVAIPYLLDLDRPTGLAVSSPLPSRNKLKLLRTLGALRIDDPATKEKFDAALNAVSSAVGKRNELVHGAAVYFSETNEIRLRSWSANGHLKLKDIPISVDSLRQTADEIERAILGLGEFLQSLERQPKI